MMKATSKKLKWDRWWDPTQLGELQRTLQCLSSLLGDTLGGMPWCEPVEKLSNICTGRNIFALGILCISASLQESLKLLYELLELFASFTAVLGRASMKQLSNA